MKSKCVVDVKHLKNRHFIVIEKSENKVNTLIIVFVLSCDWYLYLTTHASRTKSSKTEEAIQNREWSNELVLDHCVPNPCDQ